MPTHDERMNPRTKREADYRIAAHEANVERWLGLHVRHEAAAWMSMRQLFVTRCSKEAARLRALRPSLPE